MSTKTSKYLATIVSWVFSPLMVPLVGFFLLLAYLPGAALYSSRLKMVLVAIVAISGFLVPLTYYLLTELNRRIFKEDKHRRAMTVFYLFICMSLFLGGQFISRIPVDAIFKAVLFGGSIVSFLALLVSLKSNLSEHTLALGAFWGVLVSLNFRYGMNITFLLMLISTISGIVGASRIYLEKHTPVQVYTGFLIGSVVMFCFFLFI